MLRVTNLIKSTLEQKRERKLNGAIAIWNFTNRCNLECKHCYSYAKADSKDFLSTSFIISKIKELKEGGVKFVIFSGGEPLIREDIFEIAQEMHNNGIFTYLSTNGLFINKKNVSKIIEHFNYIGISIDGIEEVHDNFRGMRGAFKKSIEAIKLINSSGGSAGIRFTITKDTQDSFYDIFELATNLGVNKLYISHLVYSGRGLDNLKMDITKEKRREFVEYIIKRAFEFVENNIDFDIVTGNMEMDAILLYKEFKKRYPHLADDLLERLKNWGGNSAGRKLLNINYKGEVRPDPFFPFVIGDLTKSHFRDIWVNSDNEILKALRKFPRELKGDCQNCKAISICNGGSRSRAYAIYGDLWEMDPSCYLSLSEREMNFGR